MEPSLSKILPKLGNHEPFDLYITVPLAKSEYDQLPDNYKKVAIRWLNGQLLDPDSARIQFVGTPSRAVANLVSRWVPAWAVTAEVNAKDRMGAYVGETVLVLYFYEGQVVDSFDPQSEETKDAVASDAPAKIFRSLDSGTSEPLPSLNAPNPLPTVMGTFANPDTD